jgi:hypothetical protein
MGAPFYFLGETPTIRQECGRPEKAARAWLFGAESLHEKVPSC